MPVINWLEVSGQGLSEFRDEAIIVFSGGYSEVAFRTAIHSEVIGLIVYNNVYTSGECDKLYHFIKH